MVGPLQPAAIQRASVRIAVVTSVRQHSFETDLASLRRLNPRPVTLSVGSYDLAKGGEFDDLLAQHGLCRSDFPMD